AVEPLTIDFPDEQTAPRLHEANVAGGGQVVPAVLAQRLDPVLPLGVGGEPRVGSGNGDAEAEPGGILGADQAFVIQDQFAGRLVQLLRMTGDATALEDWFDIAEILDRLGTGLEAQAGLVLGVPLL